MDNQEVKKTTLLKINFLRHSFKTFEKVVVDMQPKYFRKKLRIYISIFGLNILKYSCKGLRLRVLILRSIFKTSLGS